MRTPIALIGGLVLTLGAFSPAFAQNTDSTIPQGVNSSATKGGNSSASSGSGSWQSSQPNENQDQGANQSQSEGENQSSAAEQGKDDQRQTGANAVSASSLSYQQSRIGRQIHRLDKNLSDAESYEAEGREDWMNGDTAGARRDFQIAEHILRMATGGGNFEPAMLGGNPHRQEKMVENAIKRAESNGQNVSDAKQLLQKGKDALNNGDMAKASRHFRAAELALGIPVEVGYAEVWESAIPVNGRQNGSAEYQNGAAENQQQKTEQGSQANSQSPSGNQQTAWNQSQNVKNDISRAAGQGKDVDDAKFLLHDGEQALQNGDQAKAQRDFRAAERALSMNEMESYSDPSNQNSSVSE